MKTSKDIQEIKLIATFMDRILQTDGISWFDENYVPLKYNDWNTLMPVVEKIETTKYYVTHEKRGKKLSDVYISTDYQDHKDFPIGWTANVMTTTMGDIYRSDRHDEIFNTKYEATYKACIAFITWYNNQNK
jgi:hypothetical protein